VAPPGHGQGPTASALTACVDIGSTYTKAALVDPATGVARRPGTTLVRTAR
jgi:predicted NBD/HSP70 family sugar kinase